MTRLVFVLFVALLGCRTTPTITSVLVSPSTASVASTGTQVLQVTVAGTGDFDSKVNWTTTLGTLSATTGASVTLTAPSVLSSTNITVTATSAVDSSKSGSAVVTVNPPPPSVSSVSVSAVSSTLASGGTTNLSAVVVGANNPNLGVTWSIQSGGGSLGNTTANPVGFTAPTVTTQSVVVVKATSVQDSTKSGTVNLTINPPPPTVTGVALAATKVVMRPSESTTISSVVSGTGAFNTGVTWTLEDSTVGSLSGNTASSVTYTAPTTGLGKVVQITATSVQDTTFKKTIFLGLYPKKDSIAAGGFHSLALKSDGTVLVWGNDGFGEQGNGSGDMMQTTPQPVVGVNNAVAIAAGSNHNIVLKTDGTLMAWGANQSGQLGDGTLTQRDTPIGINGISNIIAIAAGSSHSLALKSDGTVLAWGSNQSGATGLGIIGNTEQTTPITVSGASNIIALSSKGDHSLALKADGSVLAWGFNGFGQLGTGTTENLATPTALNLTGIVGISGGNLHSLALTSSGTVLSWGYAVDGALGRSGNSLVPGSVNLNDIVTVEAGSSFSTALKTDGSVLAWGQDNTHGQLGNDSSLINQPTPVAVANVSNIVSIAAGFFHSLALKSDGTLQSWGSDQQGQLGNDTNLTDQPTPVSVALGSSLIRLP
jgi:hypothetical protein